MKAQVLYGINDLRYEEREVREPGEGEVLLKVLAAGICGSDIPRIYRTGAHKHPLVPGHEFSARVVRCGAGVDRSLEGKAVGVFPLIPCGKCLPCLQKKYEMCRNYNYLGSRCDGAFAEYLTAPADRLIVLPEGVSAEAAAMLEPFSVAAHAMRASDPQGTVAVIGLGTIGLMLTALLKDAGVQRILAVGNKEFQFERAVSLGVSREDCFDARIGDTAEWIRTRCGGYGADSIFECVGRAETVAQAVDAAAPGGSVMLVGNPASDMALEKNIYWKILRNQLTLRGTWNSSFTGDAQDDWHYVLERIQAGGLRPEKLITQRFPLEKLGEGLRIMRDKTGPYIKVMIVADREESAK